MSPDMNASAPFVVVLTMPPRISPPEQAFNDYYLEGFDALE